MTFNDRYRPVAIEHYLHYLKQRYDFDKLEDTLAYLGRTEEAAVSHLL